MGQRRAARGRGARVKAVVIIPTYNRKESLLRILDSLSRQTYPVERFEVIVVDDGGSDGTEAVAQNAFPFPLRYVRQENQGDAVARNRGAQEAQGEILQFLDDDIVTAPDFISAIVLEHSLSDTLVVIGNLLTMPSSSPTVFEQVTTATQRERNHVSGEIDFTELLSGVLSLRRKYYLSLGMMQPVVQSGSSVWCDVEFAYRARVQGFAFRRCGDAIAYHDDYALRDLRISCQRAKRAASTGIDLFQRHPELRAHLPSLQDKGPIAWRQDPSALILRKLVRQLASSSPIMWTMERTVPFLERRGPASKLLALLYRWIISGYIYHGYREGLRAAGKE